MTLDADKLRALDAAATPGPWKVFAMFGDSGPQEVCRADDYAMGGVCVPHRKADAKLVAYLRNSVPAALAMAEGRKAWAEAVSAIMARCEALEDEAANEMEKDNTEHSVGYWRGQKMTAKDIRRELHDITRGLRSGER